LKFKLSNFKIPYLVCRYAEAYHYHYDMNRIIMIRCAWVGCSAKWADMEGRSDRPWL